MFYEKKLNIGYSTIGKQGILKVVSIMNFLQDTASEHAARMGVSGFDLAKENLGWVIFRYHIEIINHPSWQDEIIIRTDRFSCKNLYEIRNITIKTAHNNDFTKINSFNTCQNQNSKSNYLSQKEDPVEIKNQDNELVNAKVCWVMVNKKNGKPTRLSRFMDKKLCDNNVSIKNKIAENGEDTSNNRDSASQNSNELEFHFPEIIKPEKIHYQLPFKVRMHDLDLNGHVNNAIFVEWGVETVPEKIISNFFPSNIDVVFNKESLYGDTIISQTEIRENNNSPITFHSIIRQQDQAELARLNISWQPLPSNLNLF